jgi:hypothetical protein
MSRTARAKQWVIRTSSAPAAEGRFLHDDPFHLAAHRRTKTKKGGCP